MTTETVTVTQADREAAAGYERFMLNDVNSYTRGITNGRHDSHPLVQAFARHRLASEARSSSEVERALRDHISEQITHVENRIKDGAEMGAAVWRIALEDVVRENRQVLKDTPNAE